ncbi:M14 family zinc carboxypeptidase [Sediminicola luteus]|uniref:Zinc carboxypeptidase n=1 Tax=Sediminicola luteus TaxID=319238 RepID=A0A2A4G7G9_9FLAO|nr:M14 family metallopeptidase [Sediminicola luteus]PCE64919.1 zinc carboxypeptidase [Sediminicola luteus]
MLKRLLLLSLLCWQFVPAQDYFLEKYQPYAAEIPTPEDYLGYGIGEHHTRHDLIVSYLEKLAEVSDRATITEYGRTHEGRKLVMLTVGLPKHLAQLETYRKNQLANTDPTTPNTATDQPLFVNLGYNVHGNEPSSAEAAMLTAYTLVASNHTEVLNYLAHAVVFIDPTINPDGRDRHTQWANAYQGSPLNADPQDAEHNEAWPRGRTNHYWFDLNRDWLLAINPESRGKLNWYHQWYPNVVTDFHEMGTQSTYFFEPMKANGSLDPIMPKENYGELNDRFAAHFSQALDSIGSFYFTKELFDGTYPGYGSSYPDLQGGLALLFEQASSRGHVQKTAFGEITFPFTIRNQYVSSMATVKAAVANKAYLQEYQHRFFSSAISNANKSKIKGYSFDVPNDRNRLKAFMDKLLIHKIKVYENQQGGFTVPTAQPQYRMVQSLFETYDQYRDSVYYDASAWSVAHFYNVKYRPTSKLSLGQEVTDLNGFIETPSLSASEYAYMIKGSDYNVPALTHYLQSKGLVVSTAFKPFSAQLSGKTESFPYGSLVIAVPLQKKNSEAVFNILKEGQKRFEIPIYAAHTGMNVSGVDLGSLNIRAMRKPKAALLIGEGVNSYEAGEVWHLLDTRVHMPISKLRTAQLGRVNLDKYNTLVMVSGRYDLSKKEQEKIKAWVQRGNTLITLAGASKWAIDKKIVSEILITKKKDSTETQVRKPFVTASEHLGRERVGGIIAQVDLDLTHPLGFGYSDPKLPIYKNNTVWLKPSKNPYATVAKYTRDPHIDGYISKTNLNEFMKPAASLMVSPLGGGRVILFGHNPNFRGSWYGTNRMFLNALFLGDKIYNPAD